MYFRNRDLARKKRVDRVFRDKTNPLDILSDEEIRVRYRLDRRNIYNLCELLKDDLIRPTKRSQSLSVSLQVMTALRYYATGSFLSVCGDIHGLSKMSASRCIHAVTNSLCKHMKSYIKFPSTIQDIRQTKADFYAIAQFPNVLGSIDSTIIPISAPSEEEHIYVSRKGIGHHSLNIQIVSNANLEITNIVAKWPGSTHDSYIWNMCNLQHEFECGAIADGWKSTDTE